MAVDLSDTLVVGISATALFNLGESDKLFREASKSNPENAIEIYRKYMMETEDQPLEHGTGYPLVRHSKTLTGIKRTMNPR